MRQILIILFLALTVQLSAQDNVDHWTTLGMVELESKYDDLLGMIVQKATPTAVPLALNGKEIEIRGYIIALSAKSNLKHFMFSRYPQNMCFFCGAAGPESAMQVFLKSGDSIDYTSDKVELKGTLSIQQGDSSGLIYTLNNAELIRVIK
ncbi:MAG: DUF3299 domain-containing protein [Saprospiraceae bacterium]|nr:DUF3299 domain-containing protein [Saprospiraceae bacterium]